MYPVATSSLKSAGSSATLVFFFLTLLAFVSTGYFAFVKTQKNPQTGTPPPPSCISDSDCTLVIKPQDCCGCPIPVTKTEAVKDGFETYVQGKNYSEQKPEKCNLVDCSPCMATTGVRCNQGRCTLIPAEQSPEISQKDIEAGWYWALSHQKKSNTPEEWIFEEAGKSSCWHKPGVSCIPTVVKEKYTCPEGGWIDCMPGPDKNLSACSDEAKNWYQLNCPDFEGFAY